MNVLSHRGYWKEPAEKNTLAAFARSFDLGFGIETDVRDWDGQLVISHDPPTRPILTFQELLDLYRAKGTGAPLALNVKADGLADAVRDLLERYAVQHYFLFDMAVPDALHYLRLGMPVYTRHSEYETAPAYYDAAIGVWVDCFLGEWITADVVEGHLQVGKQVCLVSPELHGRPHQEFWTAVAGWPVAGRSDIFICTDFPEVAQEQFHG